MNTVELESHQMPRAIVHRFYDKFLNEGNASIADQLFSPDYSGPDGKGAENIKAFASLLHQGFPDLHFKIQDMVVEGVACCRPVGVGGDPSRTVCRRRSHRTPNFSPRDGFLLDQRWKNCGILVRGRPSQPPPANRSVAAHWPEGACSAPCLKEPRP